MGDIADMMLDGTLCCVCGGYVGEGCDFPTMCKDCKKEEAKNEKTSVN